MCKISKNGTIMEDICFVLHGSESIILPTILKYVRSIAIKEYKHEFVGEALPIDIVYIKFDNFDMYSLCKIGNQFHKMEPIFFNRDSFHQVYPEDQPRIIIQSQTSIDSVGSFDIKLFDKNGASIPQNDLTNGIYFKLEIERLPEKNYLDNKRILNENRMHTNELLLQNNNLFQSYEQIKNPNFRPYHLN